MSESDSISITSDMKVDEEVSIGIIRISARSPRYSEPLLGQYMSTIDIPDRLSPKKTHTKRQSLYVRMQAYQENLCQKLDEKAKKHTDEDLKSCTFKPKIHNTHYKRSFEDFIRDQEKHIQRKNDKIKSMKQEQMNMEMYETPFHPLVSKRSLELTENYKEGFSKPIRNFRKSEDVNQYLPKPTKPREKRRSQSIFEFLYSEQKERTPLKPREPEKTFKKSSRKILVENFTAEFNKQLAELSSSEDLTYSVYIKLLQKMRFIKNDKSSQDFTDERILALKLWKQIGEDKCSKDQLLEALLRIMCFINSSDHKNEFLALYKNRRDCTHNRHSNDFSFKPTLSEHTKQLAKNKQSERNNKNFLVNEKFTYQNQWKLKEIAKSKQEIQDCTFKPEIKHKRFSSTNNHKTGTLAYLWKGLRDGNTQASHRALSLYSLSLLLKEEKKRKEEDMRDELEAHLMNYSFEPCIREHFLKGRKPPDKQRVSFSFNRALF